MSNTALHLYSYNSGILLLVNAVKHAMQLKNILMIPTAQDVQAFSQIREQKFANMK